MSIKRTIITTVVALAVVAVVAPVVSAQTMTVAQLMQEIAALQAQLQGLSGTTTTTTSTGTGACAGITFTRNLTVGSTGSDVKCLQVLLNQTASTQVATTGAGSPGMETSTFGPRTLAAVRIFQANNGFTPANQVGPLTRAKLNAMLSSTTTTTTTGGTTVVTPTGAGLQVMVASDNPASGIVVAGQGLAPLAKFVFVNGDNAPVNVTSLSIARTGISADSDLANVYLLQGSTRLTDAASVSSGSVNFNGGSTALFTVPAGSSTEITVASDICNTTNCSTIVGQTIGVSITSMASVTTNASSVKGNFPVNGNLFTVSNASLASVQFSNSTTPSANSSLNPQTGYVVWQNSVTVGTRAVNLTRIAFREVGSINYNALQNFVLNIDGVNVGSPVANLDNNGNVTFDLSSSPKSLQTGTRVIKLMADIVSGSSRTFAFSIRVAADANFVDSQYGVNVAPTTATTSGVFTLSDVTTGTQTIASGTITFTKTSTSPSGNIVNNAANTDIADYTLTAAGEPVKITDLYVRAVTGGTAGTSVTNLRNGALYANGVQIGSTADIVAYAGTAYATGTHFSLGSSLIVNPGTPVTLEIRADMAEDTSYTGATSNHVTSGTTVIGEILTGSSNAQGMVSLSTLSTPSGATDGNSLTVATGALTLSKYTAYTNQTVVVPLTQYKLADFTLSNTTVEPINLNTIYADLSSSVVTYTTNLYVVYGANTTTAIATPSATALANSWSVNYQLPVGASIDVSVYGNVSSSLPNLTTAYAKVSVTGSTASSGQTVCAGTSATTTCPVATLQGQSIISNTGSFVSTLDPASPQAEAVPAVVAGNQGAAVTVATYKFTAQNDSYTINELKFTVGSAAASSAVTSVSLYPAGSVTGTPIATQGVQYLSSAYTYYFTGLNIKMPANSTQSISVVYNLSPSISSDYGSTNIDLKPTLTYVKVANSQGVQTDVSSSIGTGAAATTYAFRAIPSIAYAGGSSTATPTISTGGTAELYKFTVSNTSAAPLTMKQVKFTINVANTNTDNPYLNNFVFLKNGSNYNNYAILDSATGNSVTSTTSMSSSATGVLVTFTTEETIPAGGSATYALNATVNNFTTTSTKGSDAVTTYIAKDAGIGLIDTGSSCNSSTNCSGGFLRKDASTGIYGLANTVTGTATESYNLLWSDDSAATPTIHSYTNGSASADWYDGYLILTANTPSDNVVAH